MIYDPEIYKPSMYYDRDPNSIDGRLTLQIVDKRTGLIVEKFSRLPASSGQRRGIGTSWLRGQSPIPYSPSDKPFILWLRKTKQVGQLPLTTGIGEFYPISSDLSDSRLIQDPKNNKNQRWDIGLHGNNKFEGSAGCIVIELDHRVRYINALKLRAKLMELSKTFEYIDLVVL